MTIDRTDAAARRGGALRRFLASGLVAGGVFALGTTAAAAGSPGRAPNEGLASYYGREHHRGPTASGERFDMHALTAAHRSLPFGTRLKVTNLANGRSVVVRINDRGPFVRSRVVDLSRAAAAELDFIRSGVTRVRLETLAASASAGAPLRVADNLAP
jgi:rare lipoprotein A